MNRMGEQLEHHRGGAADLPQGVSGSVCTAEGWSNNRLAGTLSSFDAEARVVRIRRGDDGKQVALKFNQIKRLRFESGGFADSRRDPSEEEVDFRDSGFGGLQSFVVQMKDGALFSGIAHAHVRVPYGLWIYPKRALDSDPLRVFLPASAFSQFEIKTEHGVVASEAVGHGDFSESVLGDFDAAELEAETRLSAPVMVETREQLVQALEQQSRLKPVPIGEALLGLGKISAEQLQQALRQQRDGRKVPLGQLLVEMKLVTQQELQIAFARKMGYPFVDVKSFPIDPRALRLVPVGLASRLQVLPLILHRSALVVAMPDPLQFRIIEELEFTTQRKMIPVVTVGQELAARISKTYREISGDVVPEDRDAVADALARAPTPGSAQDAFVLASELVVDPTDLEDEAQIEQSDNTLVKLVNSMILEAYQQGASDIHIEPYPGRAKVVIRFRVDGEMRPYLELPASYRSALVARIKIMCDLDISEKRKAQDGKINFSRFGGAKLELRVATVPTTHGLEDVVMRILSSAKSLPVKDLQLTDDNRDRFLRAIERPYGLILCVGPTGSGKTTTLHAALQHINRPNRKIWTAEDPVEITQYGLRQVQVNPKVGWTFAAALRSMLRADPDVIMVGEIRDGETAEIAVEASLTGHLVMSTLHTNSAPETITRLIDLGLDPFAFADSLLAVLAQRLVRRLCPHCVQSMPMPPDLLEELVQDYQAPLVPEDKYMDRDSLLKLWADRHGVKGELRSYRAVGCDRCGQTGYKGRLGIHELLLTSPRLRSLVQNRARSDDIHAVAISEGMRTLRQDGIEKVLAGLTDLAEIRAGSNF